MIKFDSADKFCLSAHQKFFFFHEELWFDQKTGCLSQQRVFLLFYPSFTLLLKCGWNILSYFIRVAVQHFANNFHSATFQEHLTDRQTTDYKTLPHNISVRPTRTRRCSAMEVFSDTTKITFLLMDKLFSRHASRKIHCLRAMAHLQVCFCAHFCSKSK